MANLTSKLDSPGSFSEGNGHNAFFRPRSPHKRQMTHSWGLSLQVYTPLITVALFLFCHPFRAIVEPWGRGGHPVAGQAAADWAALPAGPEGRHPSQGRDRSADMPGWRYWQSTDALYRSKMGSQGAKRQRMRYLVAIVWIVCWTAFFLIGTAWNEI